MFLSSKEFLRFSDDEVFEYLKKGDIILCTPVFKIKNIFKYPVAFIIKFFTMSFWTHAMIYMGDNFVIESIKEGVLFHNIQEKYYKDYIFCVLRFKDETLIENFLIKAINKVSKKYDFYHALYVGFFDLLYDKTKISFFKTKDNFDRKQEYFCSELVSVCLHEIGIDIKKEIGYNYKQILPNDLLLLKNIFYKFETKQELFSYDNGTA